MIYSFQGILYFAMIYNSIFFEGTHIIQEHRRLFNYMKGKTTYSGKGKGPAKKKIPTCSIKFFCLGTPDADCPPTSISTRTLLSNMGLGPTKLTLNIDGTSIHSALMNAFPPLANGGGYELLLYERSGGDRGFHTMPTPYTAKKIKDLANQATVYVRPMQKSIVDTDIKGGQVQEYLVNIYVMFL